MRISRQAIWHKLWVKIRKLTSSAFKFAFATNNGPGKYLPLNAMKQTPGITRNPKCKPKVDVDDATLADVATDGANKRVITLNKPQIQNFCSNRISTAKYNFVNFLPLFIFEQFRRYSNCFFLVISLLQQLPDLSPTGRYTTLIPLVFILTVSAIKEIVENVRRRHADREVNNRLVECLRDGSWTFVLWQDIAVGDFVKILDSKYFPADLLLISSSEPQGMCFIETANLDGETNLKIRQSVPETNKFLEASDLKQLLGMIECELPNRHLYDFNGVLKEDDKIAVSLGANQILQRGAMLRNTAWIFGVVIYTGLETKIMKNSTPAPLKQSTVDNMTNKQIVMLILMLLVLCISSATMNYIWTNEHQQNVWYVAIEDFQIADFGFIAITFLLLYNNLIPISLQVTLELVRFVQAYFISCDIHMYHEESDTPAMARTSNLNEELGMVKHIFSDKTGTLTQNVMVFKKCTVAGNIYEAAETPEQSVLVQNILNEHETAPTLREFLVLLTICHTVIPEHNPNGSITYHASSPDERALVYGARQFGFVFDTRTPHYVEISALGTRERYEVLNVLEFTSARKRMSVIVRTPEGQIKLMCKGADSVIYERLLPEEQPFDQVTRQHLEDFAVAGLRTLCFAVANLQSERYEEWQETYHNAAISVQFRERKIEAAAELIEQNLMLLGATAIEDKLQEDVPEAITALLSAGISIWVLTGDKQETAINIGYSCRLISHSFELIILSGESFEETRDVIEYQCKRVKCGKGRKARAAVIIEGNTLKHALNCDLRRSFLELCLKCRAVICCRASPIQKAEVVELVTSFTNAVTLAIGDGANDVAMIQKANVGVGISGTEGLQATSASDYAIAQFRFLLRLLLVHGAWNHSRVCKLILYSFYKNVCLCVIELWFALYSGWSGQILFESWSVAMYNIIFTALPPFAIGIFEKFCSAEIMLKYPMLYKSSQDFKYFNVKVFWAWIISALLHSAIIFWLTMNAFETEVCWASGTVGSLLILGNMIYTYVVTTVCLKAGLSKNSWTWPTHCSIWGSILLWLAFICLYSRVWPTFPFASVFTSLDRQLFSTPIFWLGFVLIPPTALIVDVLTKIVMNTAYKSLNQLVREVEIVRSDIQPALLDRTRSMESVRYGYAFSQEEGATVSQAMIIRAYDSTKGKPMGK